MAADAMSGGLKGAFSGEGHRQLGAEEALHELVAAWHGLAPEVREKIMGLARRD